jgi:hypothetical protein
MNGAAFWMIVNGDMAQAFLWIANVYFPFGSFWILLGLGVYVTIQAKFANQQFSLFALALFAIMALPWMQLNGMSFLPVASRYLTILIAIFAIAGLYAIFVRE